MDKETSTLVGLSAVGAGVTLGKLLASTEKITWRLVIGRTLVGIGLGLAAGAALAYFPDLGTIALVGIGAGIASLGTSGVELIMQRFRGG